MIVAIGFPAVQAFIFNSVIVTANIYTTYITTILYTVITGRNITAIIIYTGTSYPRPSLILCHECEKHHHEKTFYQCCFCLLK